MWVELDHGRTIRVPLAWFPRLLHETSDQRRSVELSRRGLRWDALDENIPIDGLLLEKGDQTGANERAA